jgi:diguanylate cyclase (GGDEF)-like protein
MKRMDAHVDHAVDLLARVHALADAEIEKEFAKATATAHTVLQIVFGVFGLGFTVAVWVGAALAWSILARVKALSDGARAFGEGNFSYRVRLEGHDELGRLASVFNTMAAELDKGHQALQEASIRDSLTGLCNRREFDRRLRDELERCERYRHPLSLLMLDLDHFKAINDRYGHPVGDKVLREVADIVKHALRASDEVARHGGEEFAVILPETDKFVAGVLAQRIREVVATHAFSGDGTRSLSVTVSIGLAGFPNDAKSGEGLIAAADSALYDAKRAGRNRVCGFAAENRMEGPG